MSRQRCQNAASFVSVLAEADIKLDVSEFVAKNKARMENAYYKAEKAFAE